MKCNLTIDTKAASYFTLTIHYIRIEVISLKHTITKVLAAIILVSCFWTAVAASKAEYADLSGHWAKDVIERWNDKGIITGYGGLFRPDDPVKRGELSAILNRLLKYPAQTVNPFADLTEDAWYYQDMLALAYEGIIPGEPDAARGDAPVMRQDAAYMIARAFGLEQGESNGFSDNVSIEEWALPYINIMVQKGFIGGFPDGTFKPGQPLTRAQVMVILDNMIDKIVDTPDTTYIERPVVSKNILVNNADIRLANMIGLDNVFISPGVGDGRVDLSNISVSNLYVVGMNTKVYTISPYSEVKNRNIRILRDYQDTRFDGGIGISTDPFRISNEEQFRLLQDPDISKNEQAYYVLTNDIRLTKPDICIERFFGVLNGNNHTVSGIDITAIKGDRGYVGLINHLRGAVWNLTVEGTISVDADITDINDGYLDVGGICGRLDGRIEKCTSRVNITAKNTSGTAAGGIAGYIGVSGSVMQSQSSGDISAKTVLAENNTQHSDAGGIAGRLLGRIYNSSSSGSITASGGYLSNAAGIAGSVFSSSMPQINVTYDSIIDRSYSTGTVMAKDASMQNNSGGIIGQSQGVASIVRSCFSFAEVKAEGDPVYFNAAGGVAGSIYEGSVIMDSYAAGTVSSTSTGSFNSLGGVVGRLRAEMKNCYSTSAATSRTGGVVNTDHALIGSGTDEASAANCADLMKNTRGYPLFYSGPEYETMDRVSSEEVLSQRTYTDRGWDFDNVWAMNATGYPLPILRGVNENLQKARSLPSHLS